MWYMRPAIFLDRDGVIAENRDEYVRLWAAVSFIPGALRALASISNSPYAIVIITNQSAVGRGLVSPADAEAINERIRAEIVRMGGRGNRFALPILFLENGRAEIMQAGIEFVGGDGDFAGGPGLAEFALVGPRQGSRGLCPLQRCEPDFGCL